MDIAFDSQFRIMQEAFSRRDEPVRLAVARQENGDPDYVYEQQRVLAEVAALERLLDPRTGPLAGAQIVRRAQRHVVLDIGELGRGTVLEVLRGLDGTYNYAAGRGAPPAVSPNHLMHVARLCSPIEPEVPGGAPPLPWPPPREPAPDEQPVKVAVVDTGLVDPIDPVVTWMDGVTGDLDALDPPLPDGTLPIPPFAGHGTFAAGVVRTRAPRSDVFVGDHFSTSGAELESEIIAKIESTVDAFHPAVVNLSAGTYTRNAWAPLGFAGFHEQHPDVVLVAAAGNDSTHRPMFPAGLDWVVAVGALGPDQAHRAWFSNYGEHVDLYLLGEGLVNAFPRGRYHYEEPPKAPADQDFRVGLARWAGTSFSAPLMTGLIASRMGRTGESAVQAAHELIETAKTPQNWVPGVGPALKVG
jgi:hypothetical protein